jgi:hypothetical protein
VAADGVPFAGGGLDAGGNSLSGTLLGTSQTIGGVAFSIGAAKVPDVVSSATIPLPAGQFGALKLLAAGVNGNQSSQNFTVNYTDGTQSTFSQGVSDWFTPQNFAGETTAVTMAYRDMSGGATDTRTFRVYEYSFSLTAGKTAGSIVLPNNRNVVVLAMTMVPPVVTPVNLTSVYNVSGVAADGVPFAGGGLDADGNSWSGTLLGTSQTIGGFPFTVGTAQVPDVVSSATVPLPAGQFATLRMLAAGVNGNQSSQNFTVHYTDGTQSNFSQGLSDWYTPQNFAGETIAMTMSHRDTSSGGLDGRTMQVYEYSFSLTAGKTASSIVLPNNRNVVVLAMTLTQ